MKVGFDELARWILALPCRHPVRLIGIDGYAGGGKSTFAEWLAASLGTVCVIPMDDFNALDDLVEFWPRFEEQVMFPLFRGSAIRYQMRDWVGDYRGRGLGEWRELPFSPTVIFEGIGAARRELADRLTFAIWIETPAEIRLARGLARGLARDANVPGSREVWNAFMPGERRYFEADGAFERAHLVVDGAVPYDAEGRFFALDRRAF